MKRSHSSTPPTEYEQIWWLVSAEPLPGSGWILGIVDGRSHIPLAMEVFAGSPNTEKAWELVTEILAAAEERGQKPGSVEIEPTWLQQALEERLLAAGIETRKVRKPARGTPLVDTGVKDEEDRALTGLQFLDYGVTEDIPGLFSSGQINTRSIRALFRAAQHVYQTALWEDIDESEPIFVQVEQRNWQGFVVVLGQVSIEKGLAIFGAWEDARQAAEAVHSPPQTPPEGGVVALTFKAAEAIPQADRVAIRRYRLPVAGPSAYPQVLQITHEAIQPPDADRLVLLEAVMNALPNFVQRELQEALESGEAETLAEYEVETSQGSIRVTFGYPAGPEDGNGADEQAGAAFSEDEKQAMELAHRAWQADDEAERVRLAQEALALSPKAVEAYLTLAEEAEYPQKALEWLEKAVQEGERRFLETQDGAQNEIEAGGREPAGSGLWARKSARLYLRALQARAETLEQLGRGTEAIEGYTKLLALNPRDHSGARYPALALLLRLKRDTEAAAIIEQYSVDDSPDWLFGRALIGFRAQQEHAAQALEIADKRYPLVIPFLTGAKALLADPDEAGSQEEADAVTYALRAYPVWWSTLGAIDWLKSR